MSVQRLSLLLVVLLILSMFPAHASAQGDPCVELADSNNKAAHHTPSQFLTQALANGTARVWQSATAAVVAVKLSQCGYSIWLFAKYALDRAGKAYFITNFIPSRGLDYIMAQARGMKLVTNYRLVGPILFMPVIDCRSFSPDLQVLYCPRPTVRY